MTGGRTLTVLVADLVDSSRLATMLGPERSDEVRHAVFARFDGAAHHHNGTLVKTMGDGCLITYSSASQGVAAGIEMVESINRLARQIPGLRLRVGVAVGDLTEEDGDVFGEAVVLARRVCDAATPGQVLVTDVVRSLSGGRGNFEWERIGNLFLKGVDEPVPCSAARESRDLDARRRLPRALQLRPGEYFVGRNAQLEALVRAWKEAESGERRLIVVSGEPGVGKTRLVAAAARRADDDDALVLFGRCEEGLALPYQPFVDALRSAVDGAPRGLIDAHTALHGGELRRLFPTMPGPAPIEAAPEVEQARVTAALTDLLTRLSIEQPLVLVIDDLHWAAPATVQALRHLLANDDPASMLVLSTFRDTEVPARHPITNLLADIPRFEHAQRVALVGLDRGEMEELIEAASGDTLTPEGARLAETLFERTGGNPFFTNQVLRHLAESGALVFHDGHWDAPAQLTELPSGVTDVVAQRLARLAPSTNELLAVAAVGGERFSHAVIGRAARVERLDDAINEALAARLLIDDGRGGYRFAHAILRDAVLANQTATERALRHRDIAATLRTLHGDGLSAPLHDLAYHLCGAAPLGMTADAARFSLAAANASVRRADVQAAIDVLNRCWETIDAIEPRDHVARFDVCIRLAELHYVTLDGEYAALEAAAESGRHLGSPERVIRASLYAYRWNIDLDDPFAMKLIEEGLAMLPPGPSPLRALALASGANLLNRQAHDPRDWTRDAFAVIDELGGPVDGDLRLAFEYAVTSTSGQPGVRSVIARIEAVDGPPYSPRSVFETSEYMGTKAEIYLRAGNREASFAVIKTMEAVASTSGDPNMEGWALSARVIWALAEARYDDAAALAQKAVSRIGIHVPNIAAVVVVGSIWTAYEQGNSPMVIDSIRMMVTAMPDFHGMRAALAVHLCEAGRLDEARVELAALMESLPDIPRNIAFGCCIGLMAEAAAQAGCVEYAPALLAELEPFRDEVITLPANVMLGATQRFAGALRALIGDIDGAIADLKAAIKMEEALDAEAWLARSRGWLERLS
ncbi:MAG TPA: AAA family ATPase [Acidimicrobiales bacterium]|nr:AAA family ATPase [Acidimicrobiales bacterium]